MPKQSLYSYNRKQYANPDVYDLSESAINGNVIQLYVLGNDIQPRKGGLTLHSVDDGLGNTANDLLTPDTWITSLLAPDSQWGTTANGNFVAILENSVVFRPTAAFMGVANIDDLTMNDVLTDSFTYAERMSDNTLSWTTVTITLRGEGPQASPDAGVILTENASMAFNVLANDSYLPGTGTVLSVGAPTLWVNGQPGFTYLDNQPDIFTVDPSTHAILFNPGTALDPLGNGDTAQVSVTYVMSDASGQTSSATLTFQVTGENEIVWGTPGDDTLWIQYSGELHGGSGNDLLQDLVATPTGIVQFYGGPGSDTLVGGPGFDEIHMDAPWGDGSIDKLQGMDFSRDVIVLDNYRFAGLTRDFNHRLVDSSYREIAAYTDGQVGIFYGPDQSPGAMPGSTALYYAGESTSGILTQFASVDPTCIGTLSFDDFYVV